MTITPTVPSWDVETRTDQTAGSLAESINAAAQVTRPYLDEPTEMNRCLFAAWLAGTEATVRALFDVQNAAFRAGFVLFDAALSSNCTALQHWVDVTRQSQQAIWEAWRTSIRVGDQMTGITASDLEVARR